jgi:hypothetical protein
VAVLLPLAPISPPVAVLLPLACTHLSPSVAVLLLPHLSPRVAVLLPLAPN